MEIYTQGTIQSYELEQQVEAVILYLIETIFVVHKFEVSNDFMLLVFLYLVSTLLSKLFPLIFFFNFPDTLKSPILYVQFQMVISESPTFLPSG